MEKIVDNVSDSAKVLDVTDKLVMPAGVDVQCHLAVQNLFGKIIQTRR